ncbi:LamB/YcsF family protein [Clostridium sp. WILCCON 0269]|uniref:5-oxoprolinase subunit A n=1 Tax=Candidatus Clostridium eludens TaxID=3381663 RepID=A0ABW8SGZ3_9CLOT
MYKVDLNCDLGESFGAYKIGCDEEVLKYITSANIACGFHAGDPGVMHETVKSALLNNVAIGAHPGLPDLAGFGRRNMDISPVEVYNMVVYQIGALYAFVKSEGGVMQHVKPHGALYNMAAKNKAIAEAVAEGVYKVNSELVLFGLSGSKLISEGNRIGLKTASEVFADRTYQIDGSLTPRSEPDAVITDSGEAISRVYRMVKDGLVMCQQREDIKIKVDTVCIHGDSRQSLIFASKIRDYLESSGVSVERINYI